HQGHLSLVEQANQHADNVIVSIFVNPTQFGENEDFEQYPNTLKEDLKQLEALQVAGVFIPDAQQMYPDGFSTNIKAGHLAEGLCGEKRPGHFDGVVQVVHRLFEIISPDIAIFGQKDYQQLLVIKQMVNEYSLPINIISADIVREADGLAMSTRNQYLSAKERTEAANLYRILVQLKQDVLSNKAIDSAILNAKQSLAKHFKVDYLSVLDANTLSATSDNTTQIAILCAVFLGSTRLIDNIIFYPKQNT
ncbi:MAG: pantoate--beta-alanine ligase, partial [Candidatus Thioglobus sp.]|nr:pantoate--beta-alanine ligase [Candidatus Thioglobus sp.]